MTVGDFFDEENKLLKGNSYRYDCVQFKTLQARLRIWELTVIICRMQ